MCMLYQWNMPQKHFSSRLKIAYDFPYNSRAGAINGLLSRLTSSPWPVTKKVMTRIISLHLKDKKTKLIFMLFQ